MVSYATLTLVTGLIFTAVLVYTRGFAIENPASDWFIAPVILFVLTLIMTVVVGSATNQNTLEEYE